MAIKHSRSIQSIIKTDGDYAVEGVLAVCGNIWFRPHTISTRPYRAHNIMNEKHSTSFESFVPYSTLLMIIKVLDANNVVVLFDEKTWEVNSSELYCVEVGTSLKDRVICITGKLDHPRALIDTFIQMQGGEFKNSITNDVDTLLVGASPGRTKLDKAQAKKIPIVHEKNILSIFQKAP